MGVIHTLPFVLTHVLIDEARRRLAVNYLFMTNEGTDRHPELVLQPFDAKVERNDYEVRPIVLLLLRCISGRPH